MTTASITEGNGLPFQQGVGEHWRLCKYNELLKNIIKGIVLFTSSFIHALVLKIEKNHQQPSLLFKEREGM